MKTRKIMSHILVVYFKYKYRYENLRYEFGYKNEESKYCLKPTQSDLTQSSLY